MNECMYEEGLPAFKRSMLPQVSLMEKVLSREPPREQCGQSPALWIMPLVCECWFAAIPSMCELLGHETFVWVQRTDIRGVQQTQIFTSTVSA